MSENDNHRELTAANATIAHNIATISKAYEALAAAGITGHATVADGVRMLADAHAVLVKQCQEYENWLGTNTTRAIHIKIKEQAAELAKLTGQHENLKRDHLARHAARRREGNDVKRDPLEPDDPCPWGEFNGKPMKELPISYLDFLLRQPWLIDWPRVYGYVKSREAEILEARPKLEQPKILTTFDDYLRWGRR